MLKQTLRKSEILRGQKNYSLVFQRGKRIEGTFLRGFCFVGPIDHPTVPGGHRIGFVVSKNVRRAVDRNRMKRLLRESYRRNKEILRNTLTASNTPLSIIFLYSRHVKHSDELPTFREVEEEVKSIMQTIIRRLAAL